MASRPPARVQRCIPGAGAPLIPGSFHHWSLYPPSLPQAAVKADPSVPREQDHPLLFAAPYAAPWHALLAACLRRATTLEWRRNWGAAAVRWLVALVISLAAGSIFWQVPASFQGAVAGMGMLFWVLCFVLTITGE